MFPSVSPFAEFHINIYVPNERRLTSSYFLLVDANDLDSASYLSTQLGIELNGTYPLKTKRVLQAEHYNTEILKID